MSDLSEALLFPRELQERSPDSGPFVDPRSYKPHLQREFRRKCVYCRISDGLKGYEGFGVDHYLPKAQFPDLEIAWANLFYACNVCNTWKGASVSRAERFLPNPCEHRMADHLQYRGAEVETHSSHGEWLADLLHLRERQELRGLVLSALGQFLVIRNDLLQNLATYEAKLAEDREGEKARSLEAGIQETSEELKRVDRQIEMLTGEPVGAVPLSPDFARRPRSPGR